MWNWAWGQHLVGGAGVQGILSLDHMRLSYETKQKPVIVLP